jgi:hypothetical protein
VVVEIRDLWSCRACTFGIWDGNGKGTEKGGVPRPEARRNAVLGIQSNGIERVRRLRLGDLYEI